MRYWALFFHVFIVTAVASAASVAVDASGEAATVAPRMADPDLNCDACKIILLDPGSSETNALDQQIAQTQARVKAHRNTGPQVERLGWLFVQKARDSSDPGYYKLAEQCAACLQSGDSNSLDAMLLQAHVLQSLHRFKEAEPLALLLTKKRGMAFDYGVLGDVEYDQGKIGEAAAAYQKMVDLRPELQAYSRVAQLRWITGDLPGAVEAMTLAGEAGSPNNAEPTAWTFSRLAMLQLQSGDSIAAEHSAHVALKLQTNSALGWLALGRIQLSTGDTNAAIDSFRNAASLNHLPEPQWLLADCLRAEGKNAEAATVEKELLHRGAVEDPRSFSLYLSTRGEQPQVALKLAQRELETRGDVFTHDALAWALQANGRGPEARAEMTRALAAGTQDGRLFCHAAVINAGSGDTNEAARYARLAWDLRQMLFPSELAQLARIAPNQKFSQQHVSNLKQSVNSERN